MPTRERSAPSSGCRSGEGWMWWSSRSWPRYGRRGRIAMHSERELGNGALAALVQLAEGQAGAAPASAVATTPAIVLRVGARWYGVDANLVREVVHRDAITRVPAQP